MRIRFTIALLLLFLTSSVVASLRVELDSIRQVLQNDIPDSVKMKCSLVLAELHYGEFDDSCIFYCRSSLAVARRIEHEKGKANAYELLASVYSKLGNLSESIEYYDSTLAINEKTGDKTAYVAAVNDLAIIYYNQGLHEKSIELFEDNIKQYEITNDQRGKALALHNLAYIYREALQDSISIAYFEESVRIEENYGDDSRLADFLNNLGYVYLDGADYAKAQFTFERGLRLREEAGDKDGQAYSHNSIASLYLTQKNTELALQHGLKCMALSQATGYPETIRNAAGILKKIYKETGQSKKALEMLELFRTMRDSLVNDQTQKATIRQDMKHEYEKEKIRTEQRAEIQLREVAENLKRRNNLQYSFIFIGLLLIFGGVISLGYIKVTPRIAEGLIFFSFLILFEFILVLADPTIEQWSDGAPGYKLFSNAVLAGMIFPLHTFFERSLRKKLIKRTR